MFDPPIEPINIFKPNSLATLAENEAKFRSLVEDAHDVISIWNLDGTLTYISPSFQTILGHSPTDWIGQSFAPLVHPDDLPACMIINQRVAETGQKLAGHQFRHQHHNGHWIWMSINICPIKNIQGEVIAFQGILRDINESKQQETALRFIVEETVSKTGEDFFRNCVRSLSNIFQTQYAFIAQNVDETYCQSQMLVLWTGEEFAKPYHFDLAGTPCQTVFQNKWGIFPNALQAHFPTATGLATLGAESYVGVVITDSQGKTIGNLGIIDTKPLLNNINTVKSILQLFAARVGAEMERSVAEATLKDYADRQVLLNHLTHQIRNSLDVNTILKTTIEELYKLLQVDWCAFTWYDPTVTPAVWNVVVDQAHNQVSSVGVYSSDIIGAIDDIILRLEILRIDRAEHYEEPVHRAFLVSTGTKSRLCVPIQTQRAQIGMIVCDHMQQYHSWSDSEAELVQAVASQLAIAINQAELYANSQDKNDKLQAVLKMLQQTQATMVQTEKMSSLGQLVAGIAHEINNPVNFIHGNLTHVKAYTEDLQDLIALYQQSDSRPNQTIAQKLDDIDLDFLKQDLPQLLTSMNAGTQRIREIVTSLRTFSRLDEAEFKSVNLHDGIDSTLLILQSRLKGTSDRSAIQVIKHYGQLPQVECFAGQLNQVFMNILNNAIDALEKLRSHPSTDRNPCNIEITTELTDSQQVILRFADNGVGIPEEIRSRIFDPFFSTKPVGQGTGMGLSISYQIITDRHSGRITCNSTVHQGSEFIIQIPLKQEAL
jgi:two-component system, NtrC family, sensor kinase